MTQVHPRLPASLLRASEVLVVEAPAGVRANVLRFLRGIPKERITKRPVERSRQACYVREALQLLRRISLNRCYLVNKSRTVLGSLPEIQRRCTNHGIHSLAYEIARFHLGPVAVYADLCRSLRDGETTPTLSFGQGRCAVCHARTLHFSQL